MNFFLIVLLVLILSGVRFAEPNRFFDDYCSIQQTNAIKGIFMLLVLLSHCMDYFPLEAADLWVEKMSEYLRQLIVVPFLFYSGYGIMESIQKKGQDYVKSIPVNRCLRTLLYADIAVISFAVLYWLQGRTITIKRFLLSLIFWDKIENNTWYFFVIICLYFLTYIAFRIFGRNRYIAACMTAVLSIPLFYGLIATKSIIWYNTFFCYHFGMWYSLLRSPIERIVMRNDLFYCIALLLAFLAYTLFRHFGSFYYFIICGCWLMTVIVGLTMKVKINNPFLQFVGQHLLAFYAFHRLPMVLTRSMEMDIVSKFVFSFLVTAIIALIHDRITGWIDHVFLCRAGKAVMK